MHATRRTFLLAACAGLAATALPPAASGQADTPGPADIDAAELERLSAAGVPVIDIRTPAEWAETGVIPGSVPIMAFGPDGRFDPAFLARFAAVVPAHDRPFVLVCRSANRTRRLGAALLAEGYSQVRQLGGGIRRWQEAGRPLARCPSC